LGYLIQGDNNTYTTYGSSKSKIAGSWYDNMWMDTGYTGHEYTSTSGIYLTHKHFFTTSRYPHLKVRTNISDHCPIWAEFKTIGPDDD